MSAVDVVRIKRALIGVLQGLAVDGGPLGGVQVVYGWPGRAMDRECVHGGRTTWDTATAALHGGDRYSVTVEVHVVVELPGGQVEDTDARAAEIGQILAAAVADDPSLGGTDGVLDVAAAGGDIDHGTDDDGSTSVLTLRVRVDAYPS